MQMFLAALAFCKPADISKRDVLFIKPLKTDQYSVYQTCVYKSQSCIVRENIVATSSVTSNVAYVVKVDAIFNKDSDKFKTDSFKLRSENERNLQLIRNERDVLSALKHTNILPIIASYQEESPFLFGLLFKECTPVTRRFGNEKFIDVFYAMAKALRYMHRNGFCHLILSLDSIFYCDKRFYLSNFIFANNDCGKLPEYCPKLLMYAHLVGFRRDVYMLGQTMNFLFHNAKDEESAQTVLKNKMSKIKLEKSTDQYSDFGIVMLLFQMTDPNSEITIDEVLENTIFIGKRNPFSCCFQ